MAIVTLTGPTASGKTTLEAELQRRGFGRAISHTTRMPRAGEIDGVHYHFVTEPRFNALSAEGHFVEEIAFGAVRYAMSGEALRQASQDGKNVVIVVEPHGAQQIHEFCAKNDIDSVAVWVGIDPREQARRWLTRVMEDMNHRQGAFGAAVERLGLILTVEQKWVANADAGFVWSSDLEYDLFMDSTSKTATELADDLIAFMRTIDLD